MRLCHGQQGVGMRLRRRHVAAALADGGDKVCCIGQLGIWSPCRARVRAS